MWLEIVVFLIICSILFYRWAVENNDFFKQRNIPYEKPKFLIGTGADVAMGKISVFQSICDLYNRQNGIVYGTFDSRKPLLLIRDPDLIKHIMIKDFDHFVNRQTLFFDQDNDNLFSNSLFLLQSDKWRDMRYTLTPAFTCSKLRQMFQLILPTIEGAVSYLNSNDKTGSDGFELDVKDFASRLTSDIIASSAFGLEVNSLREKDNDFYRRAIESINFTTKQQIKMLIMLIVPKIAVLLKIDVLEKDYVNYFMGLVLDTMKYRAKNKIHRPDMINLLMEARGMIACDNQKTHHRNWSDIEIVSQCFAFFMAGFESTANLMSFAAHELMENQNVQNKLYEEIHQVHENLHGEPVNYEVLHNLPYMDMVISEVLRKWTPSLFTDRKCTKDFVYDSAEGQRIEIRKDECVRIPICALHRDPKYFENPDVLNPERFSEENKSKIIAGTYLPFGLGPRNCIGTRFALLEAKAFLYYLIRDYHLEASAKTCIPLELDTGNVLLKPKSGFWLQLKSRKCNF